MLLPPIGPRRLVRPYSSDSAAISHQAEQPMARLLGVTPQGRIQQAAQPAAHFVTGKPGLVEVGAKSCSNESSVAVPCASWKNA
jgi:hypothetical protein